MASFCQSGVTTRPPSSQNRPVADAIRERLVMGRHNDGCPAGRLTANRFYQDGGRLGIEPSRRLVEYHQPWPMDEGPCDGQALLLSS